jgi:hypothetical protein
MSSLEERRDLAHAASEPLCTDHEKLRCNDR